jgi:type I restriction enzyme, S subunit
MSELAKTEWRIGTLSEVCDVKSGYAFKTSDFKPKSVNSYPIVRMSNLKHGKCVFDDAVYIDRLDAEKLGTYALKDNDFVFGMSGSLSNYATIKKENLPCYLNQRVGRLIPKSGEYGFLPHLFLSEPVQRQILAMAAGGAQLNISSTQLLDVEIAIPPVKEQQKIAEILTSVDEVIENTQSQIDKLEDLKKATMNELLTKGIGHTEFKETEIGMVPKSWQVRKLRDFVVEQRGGAALTPKDFAKTGVRVIPKKSVQFGGYICLDEEVFTTEEFATKNQSTIVDNRFLVTTLRDLVPTGPSIGLIGQLRESGTFLLAQGVYGFRFTSDLNPIFLSQLSNCSWYRKQMRYLFVGSTQVHIRTGEFLDLMIPFPPENEQIKICATLQAMDNTKSSLARVLVKYLHIKYSLMQDLLTGKVRVKVN